MKHQQIIDNVFTRCKELDLLAHHCKDPRRCEGNRGLGDLIIVGPGGILFREIKGDDGVLSTYQRQWGLRIDQAGGDWAVWSSASWLSGQIDAELTILTVRPEPSPTTA